MQPETTPEPARAEPVGGVRVVPVAWRCRSTTWDPKRPWDYPAERPDALYDYDIVEPLFTAPAPTPAPDAGLAEVERLIRHAIALGRSNPPGSDAVPAAAEAEAEATERAIAALRAEGDRIRADAAGRGEGVTAAGIEDRNVWLVRGQGDDGPNSVSYLDPDGWTDNLNEADGYPFRLNADAMVAECKLESITVEVVHRVVAHSHDRVRRARIAAAPAPAPTDHSGEPHA